MDMSTPENEALHLEIDRDTLTSQVKEGLYGHQWIQRGVYLVCRSCPIEHSIYIGVNRLYLGPDKEGLPKFKRIDR